MKRTRTRRFGRVEALAKREMICPFFGGLCKNCAVYIGRHYYLCFSTDYRGYLGPKRKASRSVSYSAPGARSAKKRFRMPILKARVFDPFGADL
jgi:hypothetical protein